MHFVKVFNAASSTAAALQIEGFCAPLSAPRTPRDWLQPNFLWTSIRQPHSRTISSNFFSTVSRRKKKYNSTVLIKTLDEQANFQTRYISRVKPLNVLEKKDETTRRSVPKRLVKVYDIFRVYNFVAVAERMDESIVVMKLLSGYIQTSSKASDRNANGECRRENIQE